MSRNLRKGPKSSTPFRCPYCLVTSSGGFTRDHIIARRWFPDLSPDSFEKWQVPVCSDCNNRKSRIEQRMMIQLAYMLDPLKPECSGILARARNAIDVARARNAKDAKMRADLRKWLHSQVFETPDDFDQSGILPLGRKNFGMGVRTALRVDAVHLDGLIETWIRGFHYFLLSTYIETTDEIGSYHVESNPFDELGNPSIELTCGNGMRVQQFRTDGGSALYSFRIWDQFTAYGSVIVASEREDNR